MGSEPDDAVSLRAKTINIVKDCVELKFIYANARLCFTKTHCVGEAECFEGVVIPTLIYIELVR